MLASIPFTRNTLIGERVISARLGRPATLKDRAHEVLMLNLGVSDLAGIEDAIVERPQAHENGRVTLWRIQPTLATMGTDRQVAQLLDFKRFSLAGLCFDQAKALAQHMIEHKPKETEMLYSPMMCGIVVTYMRPFKGASGLGKLPSEFEQFTDTDLRDAHKQMVESRDQIYAHCDLQAGVSLPTIDQGLPYEMWITITNADSYELLPNKVEVPSENLPDLVRLFEFQRSRITARISKLWPSLTGGKDHPREARLKVGVDFP